MSLVSVDDIGYQVRLSLYMDMNILLIAHEIHGLHFTLF